MNALRLLATLDEAAGKFAPRPGDADGSVGLVVLLTALLIVLVALGAYIVLHLVRMRRNAPASLALFHEIADAHELDAAERKYLIRLARQENLDEPARIFTEKHHLEAWAKASTDPTPRFLYDRLFA